MNALYIRSLVFGAYFAAYAATAAAEVRIGLITDLTGPTAFFGKVTAAGAAMAVEDHRKSGLDVRLIVEDSAADTKRAVTAAQKLLHLDKVDALYVEPTPIAAAVSPLAKNAKRILIYAGGIKSITASNQYAFKTFLDFTLGCENIVNTWKGERISKVRSLTAQVESGELCLAGARRSDPGIGSSDYAIGSEVNSKVSVFKRDGIDGILNIGFEGDVMRMMQAAELLQYAPNFGLLQANITAQVRQRYPELVRRAIGFGFPELDSAFLERLKSLPVPPDLDRAEYAAMAFVHIGQAIRAVSACGDDSACQILKMNESAPDRTFQFQGWKDRVAQFPAVIRRWDGQKFSEFAGAQRQ